MSPAGLQKRQRNEEGHLIPRVRLRQQLHQPLQSTAPGA